MVWIRNYYRRLWASSSSEAKHRYSAKRISEVLSFSRIRGLGWVIIKFLHCDGVQWVGVYALHSNHVSTPLALLSICPVPLGVLTGIVNTKTMPHINQMTPSSSCGSPALVFILRCVRSIPLQLLRHCNVQ